MNCTHKKERQLYLSDMSAPEYAMNMLSGQKINGSAPLLYEQVALEISGLIEQGTFRAGDRVPSIRQVSRRFDVSINTVMQAYTMLEDQRLIEARPQSG